MARLLTQQPNGDDYEALVAPDQTVDLIVSSGFFRFGDSQNRALARRTGLVSFDPIPIPPAARGAVRSAQVRVLEQFSQRSASDITSRLRRIEADRSVKANRDRRRTLTPEGIPFEDYDRFQLLTLLTHVRDLAEHFVLDLATTAEERTEEVMDRLYGGEPATRIEDHRDLVAEEQHDDRER